MYKLPKCMKYQPVFAITASVIARVIPPLAHAHIFLIMEYVALILRRFRSYVFRKKISFFKCCFFLLTGEKNHCSYISCC